MLEVIPDAKTTNTAESLLTHYWHVLIGISFLLCLYIAATFSTLGTLGAWLTYSCFAIYITYTVIAGSYIKANKLAVDEKRYFAIFASSILITLVAFPIISLLEQQKSVSGSPFLSAAVIISLVLIASLGVFLFVGNGKVFSISLSSFVQLGSIGFVVCMSLLATRISSIQKMNLKEDVFITLSCAFCLGALLGLSITKQPETTSSRLVTKKNLIFILFSFPIYLLSFRIDQIFNIAGAKFHWSYFTGAIDTLRSGGTLLWDTPSQYGIGPIFIPTLLPINNSTTAFLIFQASLMFITVGFSLYVLKRITKNTTSFVILGLIWILTYFFADPALIGPQPYPSSSAVRFGPSLIFASFLLLVLFGKLKETKPLIYKIGLPLIAAISFCWSAESSIYSLAILGAYILGNLLYGEERSIRSAALKPLSLVATGIVSAVLLICVLVYTRVGHLPDFGMFFMYSRGYAEGFGSYGLEFASPVWLLILVVSLLSVSWVVGTSTESKRTFIRMTIVLVGATGAWFSYFVGRAVPDNVIAMLPLIVFPLLVVVAFAAPLATKPSLSVGGEEVSRPVFLWWLSVIAVLLTISTLVLTNPIVKILTPGWLPAFQSSVKPLPWTDEALAPPALITALNSIPAEYAELPIAYEGYHGVLLKTDGVLDWTPNTSQVWIPTPLGLLEEPISAAKQEQILSRFQADAPRDGLFIWDIKNSFPDRAERWKQLIQKTHTCNQVYLSEDYEILQCAVIR